MAGATGSGMYKRRGGAITTGIIIGGCMINPLFCPTIVTTKGVSDTAIRINANEENRDKAFFCSELVGRSFQLAGVPLSDGIEPTWMNPREIRFSPKLFYVGRLIG